MKIRKYFLFVLMVVLALFITGCDSQYDKVPEPDIPMKTVTQNSDDDYITYEFKLPENWICVPNTIFSIRSGSSEASELNTSNLMDLQPYIIDIAYVSETNSEQYQEARKQLLEGNSEPYKKMLNQQFAAYSNLELGPDANIFDYFDLLNPDSSASDEEYLFDYECKYYSGKHGKIAAIKYSYNYGGKPRCFIECHREDIPYMVSGAFDDSLELSSGDIVLWVTDSLKASEHFTIQDGTIKKK